MEPFAPDDPATVFGSFFFFTPRVLTSVRPFTISKKKVSNLRSVPWSTVNSDRNESIQSFLVTMNLRVPVKKNRAIMLLIAADWKIYVYTVSTL